MYQSKERIDQRDKKIMEKEFLEYLNKNSFTYSKALKTKIFFDKQPDAILKKKSRARKSLSCIKAALEILRNERHYEPKNIDGQECFSIRGLSGEKTEIEIHIRRERDNKKDQKYFFISCFPDKKTSVR